jgi:hypothetical protein
MLKIRYGYSTPGKETRTHRPRFTRHGICAGAAFKACLGTSVRRRRITVIIRFLLSASDLDFSDLAEAACKAW